MATFIDCTFLTVDKIPAKNKGALYADENMTFNKCLCLVEKGNPGIIWDATLTPAKWSPKIGIRKIINSIFDQFV